VKLREGEGKGIMGKSSRSATRSTSPDDEFPMLASLGLKATDILGDGT